MPPIYIKGGIWTNVEDEIMKAAVMKYGKNQWARISSLLVRKTPKQCKARWCEWLDPIIKKTEWTREEEEKLLHLAKLLPTQWRSIAQLLPGRTASACLDHYNKLLDAVQDKDALLDPKDDPRRLRPGEIDPTPESKPARPDPVDMDEDEKEMLSEARARMACTQGKKAKRKAREKQLEEARRLSALQKRRELKAAGIDMPKWQRRIKGIDYAREIPFERAPPQGFFATPVGETPQVPDNPAFLRNFELDGERRDVQEEKLRKQDEQRQKKRQKKSLPDVVMQMNRIAEGTAVPTKRAKLSLPAPQVSDRELEEIVKLGTNVPDVAANGGPGATNTLLAQYGATPAATPMRTPMAGDIVMIEAQNQLALSKMDTPLKGGENPVLIPTDFSGALPRPHAPQTPNVFASPFRADGGSAAGGGGTPVRGTPGRSSLPGGATPMRDSLGINSNASDDGRSERERQKTLQRQVAAGLSELPAPKFQYKIPVGEVLKKLTECKNTKLSLQIDLEMDQSDVNRHHTQALKEEELMELAKRSTALQMGLPRPVKINVAALAPSETEPRSFMQQAEEMIKQEFLALLQNDAALYPVAGGARGQSGVLDLPVIPQEELLHAKRLLNNEIETVKKLFGYDDLSKEAYARVWDECEADFVFLPTLKKYGRLSTAARREQIASTQHRFEGLCEHASKQVAANAKLEKRIQTLTAGYMTRLQALAKQTGELYKSLDMQRMTLACFQDLQRLEQSAIPRRLRTLEQEVQDQVEREAALQRRYAELSAEKDELETALSAV